MQRKYGEVLVIALIYLVIAVIFMIFMNREKQLSKLNAIKYDIQTITASDFSVEMDISDQAYHHFLNYEYDPKGKHEYYSQGLYMKKYLKTKIENILNRYNAFNGGQA